MAENISNTELRSFTPCWETEYKYALKKFLSIAEVSSMLPANNDRSIESEEGMVAALRKVISHHYGHMQVPIPVYNVKHCTGKMALDGICSEEGFRTGRYEDRPEFRDLSYWSADISSEDLEVARQQACEKVSRVINPLHATMFAAELREQFGNSPVFKKYASRHGNFKFSFPIRYLLDQYKDQHCGGREPQLRILGTGLYKLEIAHYIVVHSPDTDKFNDFPEVPTVQGSSDLLPFVYWKDGTLYWRPESTSIPLKVTISEDGSVRKECYRLCDFFIRDGSCFHTEDGIYGVWNHLILAFHLPTGHLKIPKKLLVQNLTACNADDVYLRSEQLSRQKAEEIVLKVKEEVKNSTSP